MEEICGGATLFETVARSKAEWLAQGLLVRAIQTQPRLQAHLARMAGADGGEPRLFTERYDESRTPKGAKRGWRPDVVARWDSRELRIELKLLARLSEAQRLALKKRGSLLIAPAKLGRSQGIKHMTWVQVSDHVKGPLKQLFREVDAYTRGTLRELAWSSINRDYETIERENKGWTSLYRFLSTVDEQLRDALDTYRPSDQWSLSREPSPGARSYYGFYFSLSGKVSPMPYWLGFYRDDDEVVRLAVQRRKASGVWPAVRAWPKAGAKASKSIRADEVVAKILSLAPQRRSRSGAGGVGGAR